MTEPMNNASYCALLECAQRLVSQQKEVVAPKTKLEEEIGLEAIPPIPQLASRVRVQSPTHEQMILNQSAESEADLNVIESDEDSDAEEEDSWQDMKNGSVVCLALTMCILVLSEDLFGEHMAAILEERNWEAKAQFRSLDSHLRRYSRISPPKLKDTKTPQV